MPFIICKALSKFKKTKHFVCQSNRQHQSCCFPFLFCHVFLNPFNLAPKFPLNLILKFSSLRDPILTKNRCGTYFILVKQGDGRKPECMSIIVKKKRRDLQLFLCLSNHYFELEHYLTRIVSPSISSYYQIFVKLSNS